MRVIQEKAGLPSTVSPEEISPSEICAIFNDLGDWLEVQDYKGVDPYQLDGLLTKSAQIPGFGKLVGLARQILKPFHAHLPSNIYARANPIHIPQALGDCLMAEGERSPETFKKERVERLLVLLEETRSPLTENYAWGLPFMWGGNHPHPPHWPAAITTTFVLNGIISAYAIIGSEIADPILLSGANFLIKECGVGEANGGKFIAYGPGEVRPVLNSSIAAAACLDKIDRLTGNKLQLGLLPYDLASFVINHQNKNGSWYYSPATPNLAADKIIDNRHSCYIISSLVELAENYDDPAFDTAIKRGWSFVDNNLRAGEHIKWSVNSTWPIDAHDVAQFIKTALMVGDLPLAHSITQFLLKTFYLGEGRFAFKAHSNGTLNSSTFIRWSQAPIYSALARYISLKKDIAVAVGRS